MADRDIGLDDASFQHHAKVRGQQNSDLALSFWGIITLVVLIHSIRKFPSCCLRHRNAEQWGFHRLPTFATKPTALARSIYLRTFGFSALAWECPIDHFLVRTVYAGLIAILLVCVDGPTFSARFFDDLAFRAAWVTLIQVPLVFLLSSKRGPLSFCTLWSHERVNWIHRTIGRSLLACATAHMAIMMSSISFTQLLLAPSKAMTVVRCGAYAYATMLWIVLTSILPLRQWSHRAFLWNHWMSSMQLLWFLLQHVPARARSPIYASAILVAIDKVSSMFHLAINNTNVQPANYTRIQANREPGEDILGFGYPISMEAQRTTSMYNSSTNRTTIIRICSVPFRWSPGQHIRLYIPALDAFEMHPFTPATAAISLPLSSTGDEADNAERGTLISRDSETKSNEIVLMIRAHSGLTQRLLDYHSKWLSSPCPNASSTPRVLTGFIDGPYGSPPAWDSYDNLILLATSTGISFVLSVLDFLAQSNQYDRNAINRRRIRVVWINRHIEPHLDTVVDEMLAKRARHLQDVGVFVGVDYFMTCQQLNKTKTSTTPVRPVPSARPRLPQGRLDRHSLRIYVPGSMANSSQDQRSNDDANASEPIKDDSDTALTDPESRSSSETLVSNTPLDHLRTTSAKTAMGLQPQSSVARWLPSLLRKRKRKSTTDLLNPCQCDCATFSKRMQRQGASDLVIRRHLGYRPDIDRIVSDSVRFAGAQRTMVAACANKDLLQRVRTAVADLNLEIARGRSLGSVDVYTEGFT